MKNKMYMEYRTFPILLILGLLLLVGCQVQQEVTPLKPAEFQVQNPPVIVTNIVDGDTIDVNINGQVERIRILGIDFPDVSSDRIGKWEEMGLSKERIVMCYKQGNDWLENMLNKEVTLIADMGEDDKDRYNRLLRYINWGEPDIGVLLVIQGYAVMYDPTKPECTRCSEYKQLEDKSRVEKTGCLWSE